MADPQSVLSTDDRRTVAWFLIAAFLFLAIGIGLRDPWPSDEPRFTLAAKQMVESGDWMFPRRGTELYSDKPPMLMWLEAASFEMTRSWRVAFLLPSLMAGMLTLACTWDLGRRLWGPRAGLLAAAAVLITFQFVYQTKRAQIDPLIMGFMTLANWALLLHCLRGPNWGAYWFGCFMAGIGVITKGVGFLSLLLLVPYVYARWANWGHVAATERSWWRWALGPVIFATAVAIWLIPMVAIATAKGTPEHLAYLDDILFRQTAKRYADSWQHVQPFYYFLPIILLNWFPLSLTYPAAIPRWWRALKTKDARVLLPLAWTVLILVFFSIPRGKRDVYIMPAIPMVALALAPYLEEFVRSRWLRTTAFFVALIGGAAVVLMGVWAMLGHVPAAQKLLVERELTADARAVWTMVIAIGLVFVSASVVFRRERGLHALVAGMAGLWILWSVWAHPLLNDSSSAAGVMRRAGQIIGPDAELGLVAWREQNLLMADRPAVDFGFKRRSDQQFIDAVAWQAQAPTRRWVFIDADALNRCVDKDKAVFAGYSNRRGWYLLPSASVHLACTPEEKHDDDDRVDGA